MKKTGKILLLLVTVFFLVSCKTDPKEYQMETVAPTITPDMVTAKYILSFETHSAFCEVTVNGIPIIDNLAHDFGTINTSLLASAFLENGKNEISILFTPFENNKEASCKIQLSANFPDKSIELTGITASLDKNGYPTSRTSEEYPQKYKTSPVREGKYLKENEVDFIMTREITLQSLPEWAWTKATSLQDSSKTYAKLQDAYIKLGLMFKNNDYDSFKKAIWLAMQERAVADLLDPEFYFETTDFPDEFSKGVSSVPTTNWSDYKLKLYKGGRLARLVDQYDLPPLNYRRPDGEVYYYNCYFSLIDGKLVVAR
ncbi:hypothetical protein [Halodesulfovibrio sp. MK-HDV]|jgi:hypothetical protein|uniref:hypothetical protein n=1 Tax=Halodesulfovibrio sp. MK-HDV TaxID=2599925 RepID=UPI00136C0D13|nr:hypothetical protein [Halodesulfovibrio sp. MK-HDV]KAF1076069.1 hypothetical protein MKHDV_01505 [Halodesulfovibrio sp. MK-HDV]